MGCLQKPTASWAGARGPGACTGGEANACPSSSPCIRARAAVGPLLVLPCAWVAPSAAAAMGCPPSRCCNAAATPGISGRTDYPGLLGKGESTPMCSSFRVAISCHSKSSWSSSRVPALTLTPASRSCPAARWTALAPANGGTCFRAMSHCRGQLLLGFSGMLHRYSCLP